MMLDKTKDELLNKTDGILTLEQRFVEKCIRFERIRTSNASMVDDRALVDK